MKKLFKPENLLVKLGYLLVACFMLVGVRITLLEIHLLPDSHVGLIGLPSSGLIIIVACAVSLLYLLKNP